MPQTKRLALDAEILQALDKLRSAAGLIETYGEEALPTAVALVLAAAELLSK